MPEETNTQDRRGPSLIREYDEPLTKDEAWEAVAAVTEDPKKIALTGTNIKKELAKYEWEETPSLWKAFLDPRKVPCLRETLMSGIIGGAFGMGLSTFARAKWDRAVRHYFLGFACVSLCHWTLCNYVNFQQNKLIRKTINSHPNIMSEKDIIRQVDKIHQQKLKEKEDSA